MARIGQEGDVELLGTRDRATALLAVGRVRTDPRFSSKIALYNDSR
jgi:hypothetical protein